MTAACVKTAGTEPEVGPGSGAGDAVRLVIMGAMKD